MECAWRSAAWRKGRLRGIQSACANTWWESINTTDCALRCPGESKDTVRIVKHWHRLPQEMMESPPLELLTANTAGIRAGCRTTQSLWVQVLWDSQEAAQGRSHSSRL